MSANFAMNSKGPSYYQELWAKIQRDLYEHSNDNNNEEVFEDWINKTILISYTYYSLTLSAPDITLRNWIQKNYLHIINQLCMNYDANISQINLIVDTTRTKKEVKKNINILKATDTVKANDENLTGIDPRFTFDNFVVGKSNELAYAASKAIADSKFALAESNPLFLYGGVGLGKTHLMHAIAWDIKLNNSSRKVNYMSAEKFMYNFVKALRDKDPMSFKEKLRSSDVVMIDDIQFICGKNNTQEEFFHTFNALIDQNKQIVISCDRSPSDLDDLEERIRSRLGWGLVADVHSTTYELRLGILQSKIEQIGIEVPKEVIEFLAEKITSNVRELEGALNKVIAQSTFVNSSVTLDKTKETLKDLLRSSQRSVTIEEIQKQVAVKYEVKVEDLSSGLRVRNLVRPRQVAMYLSKQLTTKSLVEIGLKFGKKDHTTVIHAIRRVEDLYSSDVEFKRKVDSLSKILS